MSDQYSISEARISLPRIVREAENGRRIELTRRGKVVAVLTGKSSGDRTIERQHRGFMEAYNDFARSVDLAELDIDPDEVFACVRDQSSEREVNL
ncbi:type II toxin-antitoxin system Phd/YefM family antitoxin [Thioalkalivibrio sp. HK1]|uniref:type II toxin-antitoxin system Phd/YefM family antitoxin n=1 Tax=Thioalkalivibrio sp. HK1 TaxID=1469245 RepID=UPI000570DFD9|nr:type II toxin-antitoxin system prevent-host-death family antitoxin [Thioalkalivibrio sp. HK1]